MFQESLKNTTIKGVTLLGISSAAGVGFWPVGIVSIIVSKDYAQSDFKTTFDKAYLAALKTLGSSGLVLRESKEIGALKATVQNHNVLVKIANNPDNTVTIVVSARKHIFAQPEFARGILYQISEKLN
jgi:hypothetical protein